MKYNFDGVINRRGTNCEKWDDLKNRFGSSDMLAMWVADMDFAVLPEIIDSLRTRLDHPILGYTYRPDSWKEAIKNWVSRRHGWEIENEWIDFTPGVVPAISLAILSFTKAGDGVLIQPPVYPPFARSVNGAERRLIENPLIFANGRFEMDFDDLEKKCEKENIKIALLCNPHNPCGRVWTREELSRFAEICCRHNVIIFSDEIHSDIIFSGHKHIPIASLSEEIAENTVTAMAPSKTFNIAGLSASEVIIKNETLRKIYTRTIDFIHVGGGNIFGAIATEAAYGHGEGWVDELIKYLEGNVLLVDEFLNKNSKIKLVKPEGTYVPFLDCRELFLDRDALKKFFYEEAKVAVNSGHTFGTGGDGFMRLNIATPREILTEGLKRICRV